MVETLHRRIVVIVDSMCVEQLASVIGFVAELPQPDWKPLLVQPFSNKLRVTAIGWLDVGHIVIVSGEAGPYVDSRWAANGYSAVMLLESSAFASDVFVEEWHVVERLHMKVLIVCDDEEEIRFLVRGI
jgi:hypothetical protein